MVQKGTGSVKRFGARYGKRIRDRLAILEAESKKKHICEFCKKPGVKRIAVGIWHCLKCNTKFTGKAFTPKRKLKVLIEEITVGEKNVKV